MNILNLNEVTISDLLSVVTNHGLHAEVDDEGDLIVSRGDNFSVLRISDDRIKFFGITGVEAKYNNEHLSRFVDKMNFVGEELRFTILEKSKKKSINIFYSTAIIKSGSVDDVFLCSSIDLFFDELERFISFIPNMSKALSIMAEA